MARRRSGAAERGHDRGRGLRLGSATPGPAQQDRPRAAEGHRAQEQCHAAMPGAVAEEVLAARCPGCGHTYEV
ncbi:hypothetical protein, partial [Nocardioides sp. Leaf374]|uniref:hypothetical protein n=1 Tax=Nocardioides sp. Leaf374 TaxID=2876560 RepID=UPI001E46D363